MKCGILEKTIPSEHYFQITISVHYLDSILITTPQDPALTRRVERLCDTVVKLESFAGSDNETNPVYKDYHGELFYFY